MNFTSFSSCTARPCASMILATALLSADCAAQSVQQGQPPLNLQSAFRAPAHVSYSSGVNGEISYSLVGKTVSAFWTRDSSAHRVQQFAVSYWPTAVIALSPTEWCIAGKSQRGATIIERWTIQPPLVMQGLGQNPGSPPPVAQIMTASVTSVVDVYNEATFGRDIVLFLADVPGNTDKLLIQFLDSKDLYLLSCASQSIVKVAGATTVLPPPAPSALLVPELANSYFNCWSAQHVQFGNVFVFTAAGMASTPSLVIKDTDRDGLMDSYVVATDAIWAQHFGSSSHYVP